MAGFRKILPALLMRLQQGEKRQAFGRQMPDISFTLVRV